MMDSVIQVKGIKNGPGQGVSKEVEAELWSRARGKLR